MKLTSVSDKILIGIRKFPNLHHNKEEGILKKPVPNKDMMEPPLIEP